jgi:hypothetical protein
MSDHDIAVWGLAAQWAGVVVAILSIGVAALFGALTLRNSRGVRDAQERASLTAAGNGGGPGSRPEAHDRAADRGDHEQVVWTVTGTGGGAWILRNGGSVAAHDVTLAGYTETDRRRLTEAPPVGEVLAGGTIPFTLVSHFTVSGPANVVVRYRLAAGGDERQQIVQVPAR